MEEVRIQDWPEPPGSHAWLPAYGFQHDIMEKDDYFGSNGDTGSTHALYLETIVEETSDDLRSERSSAATWLSDSDADSVIHVRGNGGSECDSESEREWACPAKRRRRERGPSPHSSPSLSRSSSLAQFESLERSCAAPASPSLSPDSLESPPPSPPPPRVTTRAHLSAENLSEDSGYSERARRPPPARRPEIALRSGAGSTPCLSAPHTCPPGLAERRPRASSLPAELDVCAEPRRHTPHRARFKQTFEVADCLTVSVADLTALDYRGGPRRPRLPPPPPPPRQHPAPAQPPPPTAPPRLSVLSEPPRVPISTDVPDGPTESSRIPLESPRVPPAPPTREPSASSDSTTESERAFALEMETTARRLDDSARKALAGAPDYDRELSVLTARRLHSFGAWDDVLDELRRRLEPSSPTPSPARTPSPDPIREPPFTSTPLRAGDARVRSTPELRARATPQRETPEDLRASLQLVGPAPAPPPARSVSAGSKGVTFSPVVAEVSWREASASSTSESTSSVSVDARDAEVTVVGAAEARAQPAAADRAGDMTDTAARAPRSRIAGFLSRFANFRFSGRKDKKTRSAGATTRGAPGAANGGAAPADAAQTGRAAGATPQYVRIPLKEEAVSVRAAAPPAAGVAHKPPRPRPPPPTAPVQVPAAGVLETDVDTQRTVLHARSLLALAPPDQRSHRPHKSMEFLLDKDSAQTVQVALILGIHGACRGIELTNLTVDDIEMQSEQLLLVKLKDTKTKTDRSFIVRDEYKSIVDKYMALRPANVPNRRFFIRYQGGKCWKQVIGKNSISEMPRKIAEFLKLPQPNMFTGHCFRRTSATLLADTGADLTMLKRHGGWKSSSVAEGYIENSIENKTNTNSRIVENITLKPTELSSLSPSRPSTSRYQPTIDENTNIQQDCEIKNTQSIQKTTISVPNKTINISFTNCENVSNININV